MCQHVWVMLSLEGTVFLSILVLVLVGFCFFFIRIYLLLCVFDMCEYTWHSMCGGEWTTLWNPFLHPPVLGGETGFFCYAAIS